jgi:hypothetical protein
MVPHLLTVGMGLIKYVGRQLPNTLKMRERQANLSPPLPSPDETLVLQLRYLASGLPAL